MNNSSNTSRKEQSYAEPQTSFSKKKRDKMSSNSQSYSYSYYSSSSSANGGPPQHATFAERSYTDDKGTTTERFHQLPGQRPVYESSGRASNPRVEGSGAAASSQNRITDVTDADREYEERIKDEYAKREGGA
ncbi:hypothetical protein GQX73_g7671 [Xylaria multiplex]|uniref:Uncharacterized protein n=1 Tax=Xylaria multiplex TaxID=323545 RepID=A0A7C8IX82_9PEZI|nr:hypothetical protein GQX73_g7671 [Xylaria multiplex]